jgi:hypothetical protein
LVAGHRFPVDVGGKVWATRFEWVSLVFENNVACVDDTRDPSQDGQTDVDQEIGTTSALQEDTQRGEDDGEDDLADVTVNTVNT